YYRYGSHEGVTYYNFGINRDGSLHNPKNHPEHAIRAIIDKEEERRRQVRVDGAKRAAVTRARRREARINQVANDIRTGKGIGNTTECVICEKSLTDVESQMRGIGPEC